VITIFSQYGEVMDVNLPRDKETGKTKGFGFLMYEDARSCVLAVDNLNGAKVLERTLRVDHVADYRQPKEKGEDGELVERAEPSMNARPDVVEGESETESEGSPLPDIDPEDPMRDFLIAKFKEEKEKTKRKSKKDHANETPEERRARKERKRAKKEAREARKAREKSAATGSSSRVSRRDYGAARDRDRERGENYRDRGYDDRESRKRPRSRSPEPRSSSGRDGRRYDSMR